MAAPVTLVGAYELIVTSSDASNTARQWRNSATIYDPTSAPLYGSDVVNAFKNFIQTNLWGDAQINTMELRPWARGDLPLDEEGFIWRQEGLGLTGTAQTTYGFESSTTTPADGDVAMLIHKLQTTHGGRVGKNYLHDLIRSEMLTYRVGAKPVLHDLYVGLPALVTSGAASIFSGFVGTGGTAPYYITVHYSKKTGAPPPFSTRISAFSAVGVTEHQLGRHNL